MGGTFGWGVRDVWVGRASGDPALSFLIPCGVGHPASLETTGGWLSWLRAGGGVDRL